MTSTMMIMCIKNSTHNEDDGQDDDYVRKTIIIMKIMINFE